MNHPTSQGASSAKARTSAPSVFALAALLALLVGLSSDALGQTAPGAVDHFTWDPIPNPQRTGTTIPVRLTARDAQGAVVTNFNGSVRLAATAGLAAQTLFEDGFEDGDFAGWNRDPNAGNWSVATNVAAVGSRSVTLNGGRQSQMDGLSHALSNLQPDTVRFHVRTLRTDAYSGFVNLGDGTGFNVAVFFYFGPDGMGIFENTTGGYRVPFRPGRWYQVELQFSWTNRTVDYYVDGVLQRRAIPFLNPLVSRLNRIDLYNFDNTQAWWDQIDFIQEQQPVPVAMTPEAAGPFVDGVWTGAITLGSAARGVVLEATDEHALSGRSDPFDAFTDNQLAIGLVHTPEPASVFSPITNTLTIYNPGPQPATGVTLTNRLPPGVTLNSVESSTSGACLANAGQVVCGPLTLEAGAQLLMTTAFSATNYGRLTNRVTIAQPAGAGPTSQIYVAEALLNVVPPTLSVRDVTVGEGNAGRANAIFELVLSGPQPLPTTVQFVTSNLTATAAADFIPADGIIIFPPGTTRQTVAVPIVGDTLREPNEVFALQLRSVQNAIPERNEAYGFILDDDGGTVATLPFVEDWERGLRSYWTVSGAGSNRVSLTRSNQPYAGAFHLVMDNSQTFGNTARSEINLAIDLAGAVNPILRFRARGSSFDPSHGPPPSPFVGAADFDGVAISMDGLRWYEAVGLRSLAQEYTEFVVPLDEIVSRHGLTYTSTFRIRFCRVTSYSFPLGGMAVDDISILAEPSPLQAGPLVIASESCVPPNQAIDPGETVTAWLWLTNTGTRPIRSLTANLVSDDNLTAAGESQVYGDLVSGGPGVAKQFTFTASGVCGGTLTATLELAAAGVPIGRVRYEAPLGHNTTNAYTFSSATPIAIPTNGPAAPYPSTIQVADTAGIVDRVVVTLRELRHPIPDHVDILLRGPGGQTVTLMSDAGGALPVEGVTLVFDGASTNRLPDNDQIVSGTYGPTNHGGGDAYPSPAPGGPYGTALGAFKGAIANGTWELYVVDDTEPIEGSIAGWALALDTRTTDCCGIGPAADLSVSMFSSLAVTALDGVLRYTATVQNRGPDPAVNVIFTNVLPRGASFVAATSAAGACSFDAGTVRCPLGTLASNGVAEVTLDVRTVEAGSLTNLATVAAATRDPSPLNNAVQVVTSVLAPVLTMQSASATESASGVVVARFNLGLSPSTRTGIVAFATASLTAVAGTDFVATNGLVIFQPGETTKTIEVRILDDLLDEANEDFLVTFFNGVNISIVANRATGTIVDNDTPPTVSVFDTSVAEGDTGLTPLQFRFQLSSASGQSVSVFYATTGGTATAGTDYLATNNVVAFNPGETSRLVPVQIRGDRQNEGNETIVLTLSSPSNVTIADGTGVGTIINDDPLPSFSVQAGAIVAESCLTPNGAVDPGETATIQFVFRNNSTGLARATNVFASLLSTGGVVVPSAGRGLGAFAPGGSAIGEFTLTANALCGEVVHARFDLRDGDIILDPVEVSIPVGRLIANFAENFDRVTAPALPPGWTVLHAGAGIPWRTTNAPRDSIPNSIVAPDPDDRSTNALISPPMEVSSSQAQVSFRHSFNTERNWDGGTLAISIDNEPFVDLAEAGGSFLVGGYNGLADQSWPAWSGDSGGYIPVVAALPPDLADRSFRLRWQFTSDSSVGSVGWFVDSIMVTDGFDCCLESPPVLTLIQRDGPRVTLHWTSVPGRRYQVQYKSSLADSVWTELTSDQTSDAIAATATDELPSAGQRYYRVVWLP